MMTIEDAPVTFGLWSRSWVGGDQVAGLLRCALRAPGHHIMMVVMSLMMVIDDDDDDEEDCLIEENMVPSSVGSEHRVHRQEKYFVSAANIIQLKVFRFYCPQTHPKWDPLAICAINQHVIRK